MTAPEIISAGSRKKYRSCGAAAATVTLSALPFLRPERPIRWMNLDWFGGTLHKSTLDRSPMSTPISRVGVAEMRFGSHFFDPLDLNRFSSSSRSSRLSNPVCSAGLIL